jgi:hypothetical protein
MSGLVRVGVRIIDKDILPANVHLTVSSITDNVPYSVEVLDAEPVWIAMCSHLLPDGQGEIYLTVNGNEESKLPIYVSNPSSLASAVRGSLENSNAPLFLGLSVGSEYFDYDDSSLMPWFDRPDFMSHLNEMKQSDRIDSEMMGHLEGFVRDGFIVLEDLIDEEHLSTINGELDTAIEAKYQGYAYGESTRLHDLHAHYPGINHLWRHPKVMKYLEVIFQSTPRPCQTLTYIFGSQQGPHQDTVHLTPFPAGYMCGVWAAIEDVRVGSGELVVYKGSHRIPRIYLDTVGCEKVFGDETEFVSKVVKTWNEHLEEGEYEEEVYRPKAGDVLIWHENLMHAGSARELESLSRRSIVSHVFADGCIAYYDSSGSVANMDPL